MTVERRTLLSNAVSFPAIFIERRSEPVPDPNGGEPKFVEREWCVGYASVFGSLSLDLRDEAGDFVERIDPRAFDRVLAGKGGDRWIEPRALWNHNPNYPLARYPDTLKLSVDERGLRYEFVFPRSSYGQDLRMNIEDGIVRGSSFGFTCAPGGETWGTEDGRSVRTVTDVEALYDVSPTTYPAYPDSDVAVAKRSYDQFLRSGGGRTGPKKPVMVTRSQISACLNGSAALNRSTVARSGASIRKKLPIMLVPSSATSGPDITILTPKAEVSDKNALCAS